MTDFSTIWRRETGFWLDGRDHYERYLAPGARMVFPQPAGILEVDQIRAGLEGAPRWSAVDFAAQAQSRLHDTVVTAYQATGHRPEHAPCKASCSSTHVLDGGDWKLLLHQQTPRG